MAATTRYPGRRTIAMLLALGFMCACGGGKPGPTKTSALTPQPSVTVTLGFETASNTITASVSGSGFVPRSDYQVQMRRGTCLKPGRFLFAFTLISVRADGVVDTQTKAGSASPIPKDVHLELHLLTKPGSQVAEKVESACTDVPNRSPTSALRFFAPPTLRSGGSFTATFEDARTLSLRISLVGLTPGSEHAVRIYNGHCSALGAVDSSLPDVTADDGGSATMTQTIRLDSTSGYAYVGISSGSSGSIGASGAKAIDTQLILCGDLPSRPK